MNIGIVTSWFERGAAYVSRQYLDVLRSQHRLFIYCREGERQAKGDSVWDQDFVTWGKRPVVDDPSAVDLDDFSRWLTDRQIDCVFFNEQRSWPAIILCTQRKILNGAYIVHYREDTIPFFDCHDFLICNSRHHYEVFAGHPQAMFLPWGTDMERFHPASSSPVVPGRVTFFHSGGMNPHRKGTDLVLQAFARLRPGPSPAHLVLHAQLDLDRYLPAAIDTLRELQQKGLVTVIDRTVPDLAELYRMGDVCVYPTRHEGLGLTVAESLASGLPILVTGQEPVSEHADEIVVRTVAVERYYARPDGDYWPQTLASVPALAERMQQFVDQPDRLPEWQKLARRKAEEILDWKKNTKDLGERFSALRLLDTPRKSAGVAAAQKYEQSKVRLGLRNWVGYHFPGLVRGVRRFSR